MDIENKKYTLEIILKSEEESFDEAVLQIARVLTQKAEYIKAILKNRTDKYEAAKEINHELTWCFPNLGAEYLFTRAHDIQKYKNELEQLNTEGAEQ